MYRKIALILWSLIWLSGCMTAPQEDLTQTTYALGTIISINLYDQGDQALMDSLVAKISEIESLMSAQIDTSEISEVTRQAGLKPVVVSEETYKVVERALYYAEISEGGFDPTIGVIVKLWGIGTDEANVPTEEAIEEALRLVDYKKVTMNESEQSIYLEDKGMSIDLGGIAKGYVADALVTILDEAKIERAMINLGGNVYAYGTKADGAPYNVAIQTPFDSRNSYFGYVSVSDKTVVTSGPYERYFEENGQIYHHIFDGNTGYPVVTEVKSVSIVAERSIDADALSTLLFTLEPEEGLALIESIEGIECIYVDEDLGLRTSSGLKDNLVITDDQYKLVE